MSSAGPWLLFALLLFRDWLGRVVAGSPCHLSIEKKKVSLNAHEPKRIYALVPAIKELVPTPPVPVLDCAGGNVTHITTGFTCSSQSPLVLSQAIGLAEMGEVVIGRMKLFKGIYLLEEIKVALITAF